MRISSGHRTLVAQFVIAGAVCGAAYYFLVEPAKQSLAATRNKVSALLSQNGQGSASTSISTAQIETIGRETQARGSQIQRRSAPARNEALMFAGLSALANRHSVRLDQVQVAQKARGRSQPPVPAAQPPDGQPPAPKTASADTAVGYSIVAQGTYTDLAGFIGDLARNMGFTVITGLRITPVGDETPDQLRADISTEHFAFDASAVVAGVQGEAKP